jgi:hypothetical protein
MLVCRSYPLSDSDSGGDMSVWRGHLHVTYRDDIHPIFVFRQSHVRLLDHCGHNDQLALFFILDRVRL